MSISENNRIAKNTMYLYIRMALTMIVSLYTVRVVLNVLGEVDYGIYNVVGGIVVMFSFLSSTLASASQRYFAFELGRQNTQKLSNVFNLTLYLYLIVVCIVVLLSETIGLWFLNTKINIPIERMVAAKYIYQFSVFSFCYSLVMTPYQALLIAREDMNVYAFVGVLESILYLAVAFLIKAIKFDHLIIYGLLILIVRITTQSIYIIIAYKRYPESHIKWYWDSYLVKDIASYSGWNLLGAIANVARSQGINILISMFFSPAINAARGLAHQVSGTLNSFASNFYTAVRPQVTKRYANGDVNSTNSLIFSSSKFSYYLILFLAVSVIVYVGPILKLWLVKVPQYTELFVSLVIITALIDSLSNPLMTLAQATGKVKTYQLVVSTLLILNFPISYIFLKLGFPAEYTMYTAIVISIILLFARIIILKYLTKFPAKEYCIKILTRVIVTSFTCYGTSMLIRYLVYDNSSMSLSILFFSLFLSVLSNIVVICFIGLDKDERDLIIKFLITKVKKHG